MMKRMKSNTHHSHSKCHEFKLLPSLCIFPRFSVRIKHCEIEIKTHKRQLRSQFFHVRLYFFFLFSLGLLHEIVCSIISLYIPQPYSQHPHSDANDKYKRLLPFISLDCLKLLLHRRKDEEWGKKIAANTNNRFSNELFFSLF